MDCQPVRLKTLSAKGDLSEGQRQDGGFEAGQAPAPPTRHPQGTLANRGTDLHIPVKLNMVLTQRGRGGGVSPSRRMSRAGTPKSTKYFTQKKSTWASASPPERQRGPLDTETSGAISWEGCSSQETHHLPPPLPPLTPLPPVNAHVSLPPTTVLGGEICGLTNIEICFIIVTGNRTSQQLRFYRRQQKAHSEVINMCLCVCIHTYMALKTIRKEKNPSPVLSKPHMHSYPPGWREV